MKANRLIQMKGNEFVRKILSGERDFTRIIIDGRGVKGSAKPLTGPEEFEAMQEYLKSANLKAEPLNLGSAQLHYVNIDGIYMPYTVARGIVITGFSSIRGVNLEGANLKSNYDTENSKVDQTELIANFDGSNMKGVDFHNADLCSAQFRDCDLRNADFYRVSGDGFSFDGANLEDANFTRAFLNRSRFKGACVRGANFEHAQLYYSELEGVVGLEDAKNLEYAVFNNTKVDAKARDIIRKKVLDSWKDDSGHLSYLGEQLS
jgi:uncharacterized protein YjbI with pentapeptide repeats